MKKVIIYSERLDMYGFGEIIAINEHPRFRYIVRVNENLKVRLRKDEFKVAA